MNAKDLSARHAISITVALEQNFSLDAETITTVQRFRMERESQLVEKITRALTSGLALSSRASKSLALSSHQRPPTALRRNSFGLHRHPGNPGATALRLGIGDDAAIISPRTGTEWVLTCDAFLEGVHFLAKTHPAESVGYKSLARATSDLAAMGANPRFFLLTLALPRHAIGCPQGTALAVPKSQRHFRASAPEVWLNSFLKGISRAARELGMAVIGGDTTRTDRIFVSITALGEIARGRALTRSGAQPGDLIYVSGKLGRAQLGLELVLRGLASDPRFRTLTQSHLYPKIRVELGHWLTRHRTATSAMDISDGLSTDLARLCTASQVGAKIWADKIPVVAIPAAASKKLRKRKLVPLQLALHGGEDYELLFTVPPRQAKGLREAPGSSELTAIGEITANRKITLVQHDGRNQPLKLSGWDPFGRP
jgi:thiamine-monophosphate kinase